MHNSIELLIIEDNPGDVRLIMEALKGSKYDINLTHKEDGNQALEYLRNGIGVSLPNLILLDWNLPVLSGNTVLTEIKSDPLLKHIPIIVLSSSEAQKDIKEAYDSYANCFITKPIDLSQLLTVVKTIEEFWFTTVKLARGDERFEN